MLSTEDSRYHIYNIFMLSTEGIRYHIYNSFVLSTEDSWWSYYHKFYFFTYRYFPIKKKHAMHRHNMLVHMNSTMQQVFSDQYSPIPFCTPFWIKINTGIRDSAAYEPTHYTFHEWPSQPKSAPWFSNMLQRENNQ